MGEFPVEAWQAHLQAYLNCLELCQAFKKQVDDGHVRRALDVLLDEGQDALASLAGCLRQQGAAPGALELDRRGRAAIRELLALRALRDQLLMVRSRLADLVAWQAAHLPDGADPATNIEMRDSLASSLAHIRHMLDQWDQHMAEMGVAL
jgi:hypothetical protein